MREFKYNISLTFEEAKEAGCLISLADSQLLRSIRRLRHRTINYEHLEHLFLERKKLRKPRYQDPDRYEQVVSRIYRTLYMPDYVTVTMDHKKHYEHMFRNGFYINNQKYTRFSCSAGQARVSTVVFVNDELAPQLRDIINNGRDMSKPIAPSKLNTYFGLCTTGTHLVTEPRIAVIPDYNTTVTYLANFVTEEDWQKDDTVAPQEVTQPCNRADGQGLISPEMAAQWGRDLHLTYTPSAFVVRQSFLKGMLCVFDFKEFCRVHGKHVIKDVYGNEVDLYDVDALISESQFKLWDSFSSTAQYTANCHANRLYWGVTQFTPERPKNTLRLNYQFIQTLNLDASRARAIAQPTIDWITRTSCSDPTSMILFLLGQNPSVEELNSPEHPWVKALVANPSTYADPYIRQKIRELIRHRVSNACMGELFVHGNFQMMISDPYAQMEHILGLPPTGLLRDHEFYCRYWSDQGVTLVNSARSPQNARAENVLCPIVATPEMKHWYQHIKVGFIVNWYGHETVNWGGADYDQRLGRSKTW